MDDPHGIKATFMLLGLILCAFVVGVFFLGRTSAGCSCPYRIEHVEATRR